MSESELDVRALPKVDKHPQIFARFAALAVGEAFVLVNNHDPRHLRQEFDTDHPGEFGWEYQVRGPKVWRIRITKLASAGLPRIVGDLQKLVTGPGAADATGAVWKLQMNQRHLDANLIRLPPGDRIANHTGPAHDVLISIIAGAGDLATETGALPLRVGLLAWLPRLSRREIIAGPAGLTYLTVHPRRPGLTIAPAPPGSGPYGGQEP